MRYRAVRFLWLFGVLAVFAGQWAEAHEVRPAIGDIYTENGQLVLDLRLSIEPILAGANLEGVEDTNATDQAQDIDRLRALPPQDLAELVQGAASGIAAALEMRADDGVALSPVLQSAQSDPVDNIDLPRETRLRLVADLPVGAQTVSLTWPARFGTLILRQQGVEDPYTDYLEGSSSGPIAIGGGDRMGFGAALANYVPVGFDHILPKGLDHILFVLGLFLFSTRLAPLLWQVSAFTLAHTVTLAMGALGLVTIPGAIVEPIIAASIVYVAVENLFSDRLNRWRPVVIFGFGLLHGLGFASVLGDYGLPEGQFIPALIGFNIGVEIGQLTVIALAFLLVVMAQRVDRGDSHPQTGQVFYVVLAVVFGLAGVLLDGPGFESVMGAGAPVFLWPLAAVSLCCVVAATLVDHLDAYRRYVVFPASLAIALVGAYWFVERVFL